LRSVFTDQHRVDEFLAWCRAIGPERLRNSPGLAAFNADKRYLSKLSAPSIPTRFIGPDDPLPPLRGEVVIKPNVSAGAGDTGRFSPAKHREAVALSTPSAKAGASRSSRRQRFDLWFESLVRSRGELVNPMERLPATEG
jgi:hypothetical protein